MKLSRLSILPVTAIATLALAAPALACENANLQPNGQNEAKLRSATLCLINAERTKRGLGKVRSNAKLRRAAESHSRNMVVHRFFEHTSPGGSTMVARVSRAGYAWRSLGENIAWGSGHLATPRAIVKGWMNSPGHRHNMLRPQFREIGIGIALGIPTKPMAGESGATYTTNFGVRR